MKSRLEGIPRYSTETTTVPAALFNIVRLALLRLKNPLEIDIPELKNLVILLDEETWICIDTSLNDIPVLAWIDFEITHRKSLHEPIACQLCFYHMHADKIIDKVTQALQSILDERLHSYGNSSLSE